MTNKILAVIPARYASTRFPGKPLVDIGGQSMIQRVYEQVRKAGLTEVVVATDHDGIFEHVKKFGGNVCLTRADHPSGTDRCYEALTQQPVAYDYVINVQGDEPFIKPEQITLLASLLDGTTEIATLAKKIDSEATLFNPNIVKVVIANTGKALYFSRSVIPHVRNTPEGSWISTHSFFKHIGMYGYRADVLKQLTQLPVSALEKAESLEQLRWLENGFSIAVAETHAETIGIDTPEDLARALEHLSA